MYALVPIGLMVLAGESHEREVLGPNPVPLLMLLGMSLPFLVLRFGKSKQLVHSSLQVGNILRQFSNGSTGCTL